MMSLCLLRQVGGAHCQVARKYAHDYIKARLNWCAYKDKVTVRFNMCNLSYICLFRVTNSKLMVLHCQTVGNMQANMALWDAGKFSSLCS